MRKNYITGFGGIFTGHRFVSIYEVKTQFQESDWLNLVKQGLTKGLTNQERYEIEINILSDYKTSICSFLNWLNENPVEKDYFHNAMEEEEDYFIANDYSIPLVMVKWFRKNRPL